MTTRDIIEGLRSLGVAAGDSLMLHCSLSSLGYVEGGVDAFIDAVLEAVAPGGTVMMPTLPDIYRPFDVRTSPSTVGKVSEAFRLRPDARRSRHPSHAVAAIGPRADWLIEGHERVDPTGPDSPYDRLRSLDGRIVLLGVDHDRNTMLHLAEALAGVPYLRPADLEVVGDDGTVTTVRVPNMAYGHREFVGLDRRLRREGLQRLGRIGDALVRVMRSDALIGYCVDLLQREPAALLCAKPSCIFCRWARARVAEQQGRPDGTDWQQVMAREGCGERHCECCVV